MELFFSFLAISFSFPSLSVLVFPRRQIPPRSLKKTGCSQIWRGKEMINGKNCQLVFLWRDRVIYITCDDIARRVLQSNSDDVSVLEM